MSFMFWFVPVGVPVVALLLIKGLVSHGYIVHAGV